MHIRISDNREAISIEFEDDAPVNVAHALHSAMLEKPETLHRWRDDKGQLRVNLDVFLNGENIRYREGMATQLSDGDEIHVIAHIAGG
jgi:molybdopterin converting factor small subunit